MKNLKKSFRNPKKGANLFGIVRKNAYLCNIKKKNNIIN